MPILKIVTGPHGLKKVSESNWWLSINKSPESWLIRLLVSAFISFYYRYCGSEETQGKGWQWLWISGILLQEILNILFGVENVCKLNMDGYKNKLVKVDS